MTGRGLSQRGSRAEGRRSGRTKEVFCLELVRDITWVQLPVRLANEFDEQHTTKLKMLVVDFCSTLAL